MKKELKFIVKELKMLWIVAYIFLCSLTIGITNLIILFAYNSLEPQYQSVWFGTYSNFLMIVIILCIDLVIIGAFAVGIYDKHQKLEKQLNELLEDE